MARQKILPEFKSFSQMITALPTDEACRIHFEKIRWNNKAACPHCGSVKSYQLCVKGEFKGNYKCGDCRLRYNVKTKTIFEGTHIGLRKWFIAIFLFGSHKKGISSHQIAEDLGITQKSAWFMLCRIRHLYQEDVQTLSNDTAYCDETFVGGKNKNRHKDKKVEKSQGRSYKDKTPVFGMIQNGRIYTRVIPDTKSSTLGPLVRQLLPEGTTLVTDEWKGYRGLSDTYEHFYVNHSAKQYEVDGYSTNCVENFWSHLKRGIIGVYHHVTGKHLQKYCDEFAFRFNFRSFEPAIRFDLSLVMSERGRLPYKVLIGK